MIGVTLIQINGSLLENLTILILKVLHQYLKGFEKLNTEMVITIVLARPFCRLEYNSDISVPLECLLGNIQLMLNIGKITTLFAIKNIIKHGMKYFQRYISSKA